MVVNYCPKSRVNIVLFSGNLCVDREVSKMASNGFGGAR